MKAVAETPSRTGWIPVDGTLGLSARQCAVLLAALGQTEGAMRPGTYTATEYRDILDQLKTLAQQSEGETRQA